MIINGERALATVRLVEEIKPIPNADAIEAARIGGWWVVVKVGDFKVNELALYLEVDSWVPTALAPFLSKGKKPKVFEGIEGERLRTIRLRGQLSQGLLLSLDSVFFEPGTLPYDGMDLTELLGIKKWEKPIPAQLRGLMRGGFPSFIRKTDQERIQNIPRVLDDLDKLYEVSLKLDGSSMTVYAVDGTPGVCSRNINLKLTKENSENQFVKTARESDLLQAVMCFHEQTGRSIAVQGELMGPGIQKNRENLEDYEIHVFDIWDIDEQRYLKPYERTAVYDMLWCNFFAKSDHVRTIFRYVSLRDLGVFSMEDILSLPQELGATKFYHWAQPIEGLVFKAVDGSGSFKVINNEFLENDNS